MKKHWLWLALILGIGIGWKVILLGLDVVPFNADEAIVGLMARHILQGELPIFFYGQSYMGSLDAFLVAAGFLLLGEAVWVIRLVQLILFAGLLITTAWLGRVAFGNWRAGLLAAALLAIPTTNVSFYTTVSLGGYGEAVLIGNLLLILAIRQSRQASNTGWMLTGLLAGFGLWANGLTLVYSLPAFLFMLSHRRAEKKTNPFWRRLGWMALGGFLGALPWWIYGAQNGLGHLVGELLGSAVSVEQANWLARSAGHLVNLLLLGVPAIFGLRPPWGITWLALPILPFAAAAWGIILIFYFRTVSKPGSRRAVFALLGGIGLTLFAGFLFTSFGVDPSGRYFLPLAAPLALLAADFALRGPFHPWVRYGSLVVIVVFQFWGNLQSALAYPPGFTTQFDATTILEHRDDQALIRFLQSNGLTSGYSQYWVSYPLAFRSGETLIFPPRLPYHQDLRYTSRDNRYPLYNAIADSNPQPAYITANNPNLDEQIRQGFLAKEI